MADRWISKRRGALAACVAFACATYRNASVTSPTPAATTKPAAVASGAAGASKAQAASQRRFLLAPSVARAGVPTRPESPSTSAPLELHGYVGKRPIRAVLATISDSRARGDVGAGWIGNYRITGETSDVRIEGGRTASDDGASGYDSEDFACDFEERDEKTTTGTVAATCSDTDDGLVIRGTRYDAAGENPLPFFLGPVGREREFDTYYRALLTTPHPTYDCAPYVRVDGSAQAPGSREFVSYVLHWPCHERVAQTPRLHSFPDPLAELLGRRTQRAVPGRALVALVDSSTPDVLVGPPLEFGDVGRDTQFTIGTLSGDLGDAHLYQVSAETFDEPGPMAARGGWTRTGGRHWLLPVRNDGKLGKPLGLPETGETTGLLCHNQSTRFDLFLLDLDGRSPPELVVSLVENAQTDTPPPGSAPGARCVDLPAKRTHQAFRLHPERLEFSPVPLPPQQRLEALLAKGTLLSLTR